MPYIEAVDRTPIDLVGALDEVRDYITDQDISPGELNYIISRVCDGYLVDNVSYRSINEVIGVLECAKLELYRRIAVPYEDIKKELNGEVFSCLT